MKKGRKKKEKGNFPPEHIDITIRSIHKLKKMRKKEKKENVLEGDSNL